MSDEKVCVTCRIPKPLDQFYPSKKGLQSECKDCMRIRNTEWHRNNRTKDEKRTASNKSRSRNPVGLMVRTAKYRAIDNGIEFNLTVDDVKVPEVCPVLGIPLKHHAGTGRYPTHSERDHCPSIDRIDNGKGYTPDNIVVVSYRANRIKSDASVEEIRRIAEYYGGLSG